MTCLYRSCIVVLMETTHITETLTQSINDRVYTGLVDNGFSPTEAYRFAWEEDINPLELTDEEEAELAS